MMKRKIPLLVLTSLMLLSLTAVAIVSTDTSSAATFGDFNYSLINGDTEVRINFYTGGGGVVEIPGIIDNMPVTVIGDQAFDGMSTITSVIIPENVTTIGNSTFHVCTGLTSVIVPNNVTSIGTAAFYGCTALGSLILGDHVSSIGNFAFDNCDSLTSVVLPDSLTSVGESVFEDCDKLTSVTIGSGLTSIGNSMFNSCDTLTSVTIPDTVDIIGSGAFRNCLSLSHIVIPDGVLIIGDMAFQDCPALVNVTIGNDVTTMGNQAFYRDGALTSVIIGSSVADIGYYEFGDCSNLVALIFEGNAPTIGSFWIGAYGHNPGLTVFYHQDTTGFTDQWDSVPKSVLGPTATAPNGLKEVYVDGTATLTWGAPSYTGGSEIDHYVVYVDGEESQTVAATSATVTGLDDGHRHSFSVTAQNNGGNGQSSNVVTMLGVTIHSPAGGSYCPSDVIVQRAIEDSGNVAKTEFSTDGTTWNTVTGTSYGLTGLADGECTAYVRATSLSGSSDTVSTSFTADSEAPTINILSPADDSYNNTGSVEVVWQGSDSSGIAYYNLSLYNGAVWTNNSYYPAGISSLGLNFLTDGAYTFYVEAVDNAGNSNEDQVTFTVSFGAVITIDPASPYYTNEDEVDVPITVTDLVPIASANYSHYVNGVLVDHGPIDELPGLTSFSQTVTWQLEIGENIWVITVNDTAGNSVAYREVIIYSTGPSVTLTPADGSTTYNNTGSITSSVMLTDLAPLESGNWTRYLDGIEVSHGSIDDLADWLTSYTDGLCTYSGSQPWSLLEGTNLIVLTFNDTAGNSVTEQMIVIYSTGPVITTDPTSPRYTNQNEIDLTLDIVDHAPLTTGSVEYYLNGSFVSEEPLNDIDGLTSYSENVVLALAPGVNEWHIAVNDAAGNQATYTLTVVYDATAPSIIITSPSDSSYNNTGSVTIVWSGDDDLSGLAYYNLSVYNGMVWQNYSHLGTDVLSKELSLDDGSYTVYLEAVDNAGNVNTTRVSFVVDTVEPTIGIVSPDDDSYNNTGSVTVVWQGSDSGSNIAYYIVSIDSDAPFQVTSGTTSWTFDDLSEEGHIVTVEAVDNAGNTNEASVSFTVSIGLSVIVDPSAGSTIYTNQDAIDISLDITALAPLTTANMSHYVNGVLADHYPLGDMSGDFSFQETDSFELQVGVNVFYFTVNDTAGNSVTEHVVIIYSTGPSVAITPSDGSTTYNNTGIVTVSGTLTDYAPLESGNWTSYLDGIEVGHGSMSDLNEYGSYLNGVYTYSGSQPWSLQAGTNLLSMTFNDTAGNSVTVMITVIYSTTAPTITMDWPSPVYTNGSTVYVTITVNDDVLLVSANYSHYVNGVLVEHGSYNEVFGLTSYSGTYAWHPHAGTNLYVIMVNDTAGSSAIYREVVIYDTTEPSLVITSPSDNSYNNTGAVTVVWTGNDDLSGISFYNLSVYNGAAWENYSYLFPSVDNKTLTLADGTYTIYLEAVDSAGNVNSTQVSIVVDTTAPSVTIDSPVDSSYNITGSVNVYWTASDDGSGIDKVEVSTDGTTWTMVTGNSWSRSSLADGPYTIHVKVTDHAGNVNEAQVSFAVDTVEPTIATASPTGNGVAVNMSISILFSEDMNHTSVSVLVNGAEVALTWNGNGAIFDPTSDLAYDTEYAVVVNGKDLAGNGLQEFSWTFTTMKDEGVIEGTIKDADGNPMAGAMVTLSNGRTTTTDANGHFEFANVTTGSYTLTVTKDGYQTFTKTVSTTAGETSQMGTLSFEGNTGVDDMLLIVGAVVAVTLAVIGGFFFLRKKK